MAGIVTAITVAGRVLPDSDFKRPVGSFPGAGYGLYDMAGR